MSKREIYMDISELTNLTQYMKEKLGNDNFKKLMRTSLREAGRRCKKPIRQGIQQEYHAPTPWVNQAIGAPIIGDGEGGVYFKIPLKGERGDDGGTFHAGGSHYGWNPPPYRVTVNILKGKVGQLPMSMTSYGGQPPFRNTGERTTNARNPNKKLKKPVVTKKGKLNGLVFTRAGKSRLPITKVAGIAVPQMPLNQARPYVEDRILKITEERVVHNFNRLFG